MIDSPVFFSGIGGSGMLPLASIVRASGAKVAGSDRSLDAGRTPHKFDYLRSLGIQLFPQDGSGLQAGMTLVTSAAVEDDVPDVVRARELGLAHLTRPQLLARLLNDAQRSVAVGGTSGKSTVTGMIGWILHACHRQPTVMNGAVMKNFVTPSAPFASALVGDPELFVSEVDESDGSIALYRPEIAVLTNISLDHKEMDELRQLFGHFLNTSRKAVLNLDDPETRALSETVPGDKVTGYGFDSPGADFMGKDLQLVPNGVTFALEAEGERHDVRLAVPGRHNASNALAAIAAARTLGVRIEDAVNALARFEGLRRRLETVGVVADVTVIDDFAHNPDKIDATLATLRAQPGRLLIMFQPHGYGPLAKMGDELAESLAGGMAPGDKLYLPDPVYQGGTVERSRGSDWLAQQLIARRRQAEHIAERAAIGDALIAEARPGDRILIMGARDDTLIDFAHELIERLGVRTDHGAPRHLPVAPPGTVAGWKLTQREREPLLQRFPPKYDKVDADHVTLRGDATTETPLPPEVDARIVGRADDGQSLECLVVELDGTTHRPDGSTYHITWSLGPGRWAVESNDVLRDFGWEPIDAPIPIQIEPAIF